MRKQWTREMHYPNDGEGSLVSSDSFDNFSEMELKIKQGNGICDQNADNSVGW